MHHLDDTTRADEERPTIDRLLPAAAAMSAVCLLLFTLLFLV